MKKIIICIPLLLIFVNTYAQNKNGNGDPTSGRQVISDPKSSTSTYYAKDPSIMDLKEPAGISGNQVFEKSDKSVSYFETKKADLPVKENEAYKRKSNQDIPVDYSKGEKETYTRTSNQDIPVDYSNGTKEEYKRSNAVNEPKSEINTNSTYNHVQLISKSDMNMSDAELNKKYPNRNKRLSAENNISASQNQVSDKDMLNSNLHNRKVNTQASQQPVYNNAKPDR